MKYHQRLLLLAFSIGSISGCSSNPPVSSLSSSERQRVAEMVIIDSRSLEKEGYKILGSVEGLACKRNLHAGGSPTVEEAKQGVKIRAALLGADAVTNLVCEDKKEADLVRNCWQTVVCVGDAIALP